MRVLKTTQEIRRFCKQDPELSRCMKYLMTIPGIGWIVASQLRLASGTGESLKTSANWQVFSDWFPLRTPLEREPIGDRSPTPATRG